MRPENPGTGEGVRLDQAGDLPFGVGEFAVYEAEVFGDASGVGDRGLGGSGCPRQRPRSGFRACRECAGAQNRVSVRAIPSVQSGCSGGPSLRNVPYRAWRTPAAATRQVLDCRCGRKNPRFGNMGEACVRDPRRGDGAGVGVSPFTSDFPAFAA